MSERTTKQPLTPVRKNMKALSVPEQHQKKIAIATLKMHDIGAEIMGGMSKDEARAFLKRIGYSDDRISALEDCRPWRPKTGQRCHCKPGIYRDNRPDCEGTGWRIDFAAIRAA